MKGAIDIDCEDQYLVRGYGTEVRVSLCVSGASKDVTVEELRENPTGGDDNRVLLGDAYLDAGLCVRAHDDIARGRLMERREKLSQLLYALANVATGREHQLRVREGTVESRVRQSVNQWSLLQILELVDATVAIAEII